ncbi:ABC transporter ATP-binding protein [Microvirga sp. P5_D2]
MSYLEVEGLGVRYGDVEVIKNMSFEVGERERVCLLGPSGCGKTTTLQVVAGFVAPERGAVRIAGRNIIGDPPEKRNIGIMFQNYALFPHLTVYDNVAFGLTMRRMPSREIKREVGAALERVRLAHAAHKLPRMLSGGEQQRIAFARAAVIKPSLLLLDEPFSNLDARLRQEMRAELLGLLQDFPIATVMVTHDQEEAMAIAEKILVMRGGLIEQIGNSTEIYEHPHSLFAARFIGETNILEGRVAEAVAGNILVDVDGIGRIRARGDGLTTHTPVHVLVRPQKIRLVPGESEIEPSSNRLPITIERLLFLGHRTEFHVRAATGQMLMTWQQEPPSADLAAGQLAMIEWAAQDTFVFPREAD